MKPATTNRELQTPKLLVIGAHPDDIEFGMGGVLIKEHAAGSELCLVITSKGEAASSGSPGEREAEARAAAARLGAAERLIFLDFGGDGQQAASVENATAIARLIRKIQPSIVFAPSLSPNQHPDHAAVGAAARDGCRLARYAGLQALKDLPPHAPDSLWFYAVTPSLDADLSSSVLVDISDVVEEWKTLMGCHQTQVRKLNYLDLQLARARQLGLMSGCEYATALWPNDPPVVQGMRAIARTSRSF